MDAPATAAEKVCQLEALRQEAVDFLVNFRLNATRLSIGEGDDQRKARVLNRRPEVLPCQS